MSSKDEYDMKNYLEDRLTKGDSYSIRYGSFLKSGLSRGYTDIVKDDKVIIRYYSKPTKARKRAIGLEKELNDKGYNILGVQKV